MRSVAACLILACLVGCAKPPKPPVPFRASSMVAFAPAAPVTNYSVKLAWDASLGTNRPAGYVLNWGTKSGVYPQRMPVGNVTNATLTGLLFGVQYFIAATAINAAGEESDFSNEIMVPAGTIVLISQIESSTNMQTWGPEARLTNTLYFSNQPPQKFFRDKLTILRQ